MLHKIGIAEREAIGVDRMYTGMLSLGHMPPDISEDMQREVQVVVSGGKPQVGWLKWLGAVAPAVSGQDIRLLMLLYRLATVGWADTKQVAEVLQLSDSQVGQVLTEAQSMNFQGKAVVVLGPDVENVGPLWFLSSSAQSKLEQLNAHPKSVVGISAADTRCVDVARARGRINSVEAGHLLGTAP